MVTASIKIEVFNRNNQRLVNAFYKQYKRNVSVNREDFVVVAVEQSKNDRENKIRGVAFIRKIPGLQPPELLFRSLFVAPSHRNNGIASKIIHLTLQHFPSKAIYTVTDKSLIDFYSQFGFTVCNTPPDSIANLKTKKSPTVMVRLS